MNFLQTFVNPDNEAEVTNNPSCSSNDQTCTAEADDNDHNGVKPMDVEVEGGDINVVASTSSTSELESSYSSTTNVNSTENLTSKDQKDQQSLSSQMSSPSLSSSIELEAPFMSSATTSPSIPLVLDNITNSPRSLIQDVFSNSPTIKCHDEDRLAVGSNTTQIQQPVGDFIKGICF